MPTRVHEFNTECPYCRREFTVSVEEEEKEPSPNPEPSQAHPLRYYKIAQVCDLLQVTRKTVLRWIHSRRLNAVKLGPGSKTDAWYIAHSELERFVSARKEKHGAKQ